MAWMMVPGYADRLQRQLRIKTAEQRPAWDASRYAGQHPFPVAASLPSVASAHLVRSFHGWP